MSDTDSFIDEVTEEVRRDRFYLLLRRYGWIAGLVVVLIVGGAAWSEYRKAQTIAAAEGLGDQILAALEGDAPETRRAMLETITTSSASTETLVAFLTASEAEQAGDTERAVELLDAVATNGEIPFIYTQIAAFKSLVLQADTMDGAARRQQLEAMAQPGAPLALLAQEQLALQDVAEGQTQAGIDRYQAILQDAGASADLQQRAYGVIVSLGGTPEISAAPSLGN